MNTLYTIAFLLYSCPVLAQMTPTELLSQDTQELLLSYIPEDAVFVACIEKKYDPDYIDITHIYPDGAEMMLPRLPHQMIYGFSQEEILYNLSEIIVISQAKNLIITITKGAYQEWTGRIYYYNGPNTLSDPLAGGQ